MSERSPVWNGPRALAVLALVGLAASAGCASDDHYRCSPDGGAPVCDDDQRCTPRGYCANLCVRDGGPDDWYCAAYETCDPKLGYCVPRSDGGATDAGAPDGSASDAGAVDAGTTDAGSSDGGSSDAGTASCRQDTECTQGLCVVGACRSMITDSLDSSDLGGYAPLRVAVANAAPQATMVIETEAHGLFQWVPSSGTVQKLVSNSISSYDAYPAITVAPNGDLLLSYVDKSRHAAVWDLSQGTLQTFFSGLSLDSTDIDGTYLAVLTTSGSLQFLDTRTDTASELGTNVAAFHSANTLAGLSLLFDGTDAHVAYITTSGDLGFAPQNSKMASASFPSPAPKPASPPQLLRTADGQILLGFLQDDGSNGYTLRLLLWVPDKTQWMDVLTDGGSSVIQSWSWPTFGVGSGATFHVVARFLLSGACQLVWFRPNPDTPGGLEGHTLASCSQAVNDLSIALEVDASGGVHIAYMDLNSNGHPVVRYIRIE